MHRLLIKLLAFAGVFGLISTAAVAQEEPTWAGEIAQLVFTNCTPCHREGGVAPFPLTTYEEVSVQAAGIDYTVSHRHMPPWLPDPNYSHFANERALSDEEISTIIDWIAAEMPIGEPATAPELPVFDDGEQIAGTADVDVRIPVYESTATDEDDYRNFVIPLNLDTEQYISGVEIIPGNRSIVHHVILMQDSTHICQLLDNVTPEVGYSGFGSVGTNDAEIISFWIPGTRPLVLPANLGIRLKPGADLVLKIHYPMGTGGELDSTRVRLFFSDAPVVRRVYNEMIISHNHHLTNRPLEIQPNQAKTFYGRGATFKDDVSLLGLVPHMHHIGRDIEVRLGNSYFDPNFIPLLHIPEWNFHWQDFYLFKNPIFAPQSKKIWLQAWYDNTSANLNNPNDPPALVEAGEQTTDEMLLLYVAYMRYEPGDELLNLEEISLGQPLLPASVGYQLSPNPTNEWITVTSVRHTTVGNYHLSLRDLNGRLVGEQKTAALPAMLSTVQLPNGLYLLQIQNQRRVETFKVVVQH